MSVRVICHECGRDIALVDGRLANHFTALGGGEVCPISGERPRAAPATRHPSLTPIARIDVLELAVSKLTERVNRSETRWRTLSDLSLRQLRISTDPGSTDEQCAAATLAIADYITAEQGRATAPTLAPIKCARKWTPGIFATDPVCDLCGRRASEH